MIFFIINYPRIGVIKKAFHIVIHTKAVHVLQSLIGHYIITKHTGQ